MDKIGSKSIKSHGNLSWSEYCRAGLKRLKSRGHSKVSVGNKLGIHASNLSLWIYQGHVPRRSTVEAFGRMVGDVEAALEAAGFIVKMRREDTLSETENQILDLVRTMPESQQREALAFLMGWTRVA